MGDFDPNWPHGHVTRDGRKAEVQPRRLLHPEYPILAVIISETGVETVDRFAADGRWLSGDSGPDDLLNAPAPKRVWEGCIVEYRDGNITGWSDEKMARGEAYTVAGAVFRGRHRIEFPEG